MPPKRLKSVCNIVTKQAYQHNVFWLTPFNSAEKYILYLHGGAYTQSFLRPHWVFLSNLLTRTNCVIIAPDYPLAPDYNYKDTFAMIKQVYLELLEDVKPKNIILMGDSAGGGLALAFAQTLKLENIHQPSKIILLSPWLDISLTNPMIEDIDPSDHFLNVEGLRKTGKAFAGNLAPDDYHLSPIYGPLEGLGEISLFIGSHEILVADARRLKSMAEMKHIRINYFEYKGMFHTWMLLNLPESRKAREEIIEIVNS